ncbi:MAG: metal ABC transporter permease [Deltaproteobacteria bacterium]
MTLPFLQHAFFAALLASLACGIVGSFVTVNRITYMAGAIAHSVLGGMGIARYLQHEQGILWMTPLVGAVLAALAAAVVISLVREIAREREDTVLSAVWSVGMATGILRLSAMILVAVIVSGLCSSGGLLLSYVADTPSGATIILLTGMAYGSVLAGRWIASSVGRA